MPNQAVREIGADAPGMGLAAQELRAVPICDVDLAHQSNISDEEDYRFQMSVAVWGHEQDRHGAGQAYRWGAAALHFRKAVHLRLVNVGPSRRLAEADGLGYPVCLVCGQSRSPFASGTELEKFGNEHRDRCAHKVESTGFYADVVADALTLRDCPSAEVAYSLAEALRVGASQVLDMDREDLEVLVIKEPGSELATAILMDPMPGGSGLLEQICEQFADVAAAARAVVEQCPSACERSCVDCLQTFRNAVFHRHLNRHAALARFVELGTTLQVEHLIPARLPVEASQTVDRTVNNAERMLKHLLERAGLPHAEWHRQINLGRPLGTTSPDCFWPVEGESGLCLYLDGRSQHIHGNPETRARDREIRDQLRSLNYEVIEVAATHLSDRAQMVLHVSRIARIIMGLERARELRENQAWFPADVEGDS